MGCPDLIGRFEDKVDAFRRVRLPDTWYDALGNPDELVLVPNAEGGIRLNPVETFEAEREVLREKALGDPAIHRALAILEREAERVEVDPRRSFRLSDRMREYAMISDAVVFVGSGRRAHLWNPEVLERRRA